MVGLALFFHILDLTDSLSAAGIVIGAQTLVSSITAGFRGHAIDRWGQTKPLLILVPLYTIATISLAYFASDLSSAIFFAMLMGLTSPPINLSMRPLWVLVAGPERIRTAYALDSTILNVTSLIGPAIGTWLALHFSGRLALTTTALLMLAGGILLLSNPISRSWVPEEKVEGEKGIFKSPAMRVLAMEAVLIGLGYGLLDVAVPARATIQDLAGWAAPSLAAVALGGILGGMYAGSRLKHLAPLRGLYKTQYAFSLIALPLFLIPAGLPTATLMFLIGLPLGAAQVFYLEVVDIVRPRGAAVAALGSIWFIEGSAAALGNSIAGIVAENSREFGPSYSLIISSLLFILSAYTLHRSAKGSLKQAMNNFGEVSN
jgi:MFS family permease